MRVLVLTSLAVLMATAAFAGQNPNACMYFDFDPPNRVFRADPATSTTQNGYLVMDCFGPGGGVTGVSLVLDFQCGGFVAGSADVSVFHPSAQTVIGGPDDLTNGWVVAAPECVYPDASGIVTIAMVPWFYTGPAGDVVLLASPADGKATVDCNNDLDLFCVYANAAMNQDPATPGDPGCGTPVEAQTWGSIKALYR
ncbi:MAG: hypothetical protein GF400_03670 [Candidatus Eisenbacteria bacterium]|nr:hypothetical protein [Candidatus Eisenbacteria bacterium]